MLGNITLWTRDKVQALLDDFENHAVDCDDCDEFYECDKCVEEDGTCHSMCPVGASLEETWYLAEIEYSWQEDYDGDPEYRKMEYTN